MNDMLAPEAIQAFLRSRIVGFFIALALVASIWLPIPYHYYFYVSRPSNDSVVKTRASPSASLLNELAGQWLIGGDELPRGADAVAMADRVMAGLPFRDLPCGFSLTLPFSPNDLEKGDLPFSSLFVPDALL